MDKLTGGDVPAENKVTIYTDGSCHGNPGPGGYAAIAFMPDGTVRRTKGGRWHTTNNRMELTAVIEGVRLIDVPARIRIVTDSTYIANTINRGNLRNYIKAWNSRRNSDLWRELYRLTVGYPPLEAQWVRGHTGDPANEECDRTANGEAARIEKESEIRIFTVAELLKDVLATPEGIAAKYPAGYPIETVKRYYDEFFQKLEEAR